MIHDYLKAGYPALCVLTQEPRRAEQLLTTEGWQFYSWDCLLGIRELPSSKVTDAITDPVEAISWLNRLHDTVLLIHNLHLFLEAPEVVQAIQNGVTQWKATGCCLVMVSPTIQMRPEVEKFFHVIDLPLPTDDELFELPPGYPVEVQVRVALSGTGFTWQREHSLPAGL